MPQAGEPESEVSEGRAASQTVSAEFRRTAASSSAVGRTAQARHVLRSWTVGSSWASPTASRSATAAVGLAGQQPEQRLAGLALVLRRRVELGHPARQPFGHRAVGLAGQQPEQRLAGLALVLRRRVELGHPARQPAAT